MAGHPVHPLSLLRFKIVDDIDAEARQIKATISKIWTQKLQDRKDAYWGYLKNSGNFLFHEQWMEATPIIIPRKMQKFELKHKNAEQTALRESSVLQQFQNKIEMELLQTVSCVERYRQIDSEMKGVILAKSSGRVAERLIEFWGTNIHSDEDISHKRWSVKEQFLKRYEEEFPKKYENSNPFFKKLAIRHFRNQSKPIDEESRKQRKPIDEESRKKIDRNERSRIQIDILDTKLATLFNQATQIHRRENNHKQSKFYHDRSIFM